MVHYTAKGILPHGEGSLKIHGLPDRALVWIDGDYGGTLDQSNAADGLLINQRFAFHWEHRALDWEHRALHLELPLEQLLAMVSEISLSTSNHTGFLSAEFTADIAARSYLASPGFGQGFVWINGFMLGRYWEVGPS